MDIHNYGRRLEKVLEKTKKSDILEENKKTITDFQSYLTVRGLSVARIERYIQYTCFVASAINKPFNDMTKDDVVKLLEEVQKKEEWCDRTKYDFKVIFRSFFKWLKQSEEYPPEVKWIKTSKVNNHQLPEEILTEEEVKRLIEKTDNLRDKSFVSVLYESGCRIGELLTLKIRNIQPNEYGMALNVNGKTGQRRVLVISSAPTLANWLNTHPYKDNPNALVWVGIGTRNKNENLRYHAVVMMLRKLSELSGIKKRVNPHSFRHARATHLANRLTEAQMKQYFGWKQGSDMASIYVHLSGRDTDEALLKIHGLINEEDGKEKILRLQICSRCKEKNDPTSDYCKRCASPLELEKALDLDEQRKDYDKSMMRLLALITKKLTDKDPQLKKEIKKEFSNWVDKNELDYLFKSENNE